jgi:hypothetical protein
LFHFDFKSWLRLALFFSVFSHNLAYCLDFPDLNKISHHEKWLSLLHVNDGIPRIKDPKFLLSHINFSPTRELKETLKLIEEKPQEAICRFPARYLFLEDYFTFKDNNLVNIDSCKELKRYSDYVPFDEVSLIFASEVISSASSMMGHTFLSVKGNNINSTEVKHSVSFFTEFSSINPFSIFYDAIIGGMDGFFIVRPYSVDVEQYVDNEGRNLWSYSLDMTKQEKALLKLHIWELKNIEISYLFQSYNCATLTLYLLSLIKPELKLEEKWFVSPVDVAKAVSKLDMATSQGVTLASEWELSMLRSKISYKLQQSIESFFHSGNKLDLEFLDKSTRLVAMRYIQLLSQINPELVNSKNSQYLQLNNRKQIDNIEQLTLDLTSYKNPTKSPQDTALGIAYSEDSENNYVDFTFLPASHYLYGDNRQYFSESELKMGELSLRADIKNSKLSVQSIVLYSVKSLVPTTQLNPSLSGTFFLGLKPTFDKLLKERKVFEISGSFGKTYQLHNDIITYALIGGGVGLNKLDDGYIYVEPNAGLIINMVGSSKLQIDHKISYGQIDSDALKHTSSAIWSWYGEKNKILSMSFSSQSTQDQRKNIASIKLDFLF